VDKVPIAVHKAALAALSPSLSVLMSGEMPTSLAGEATWEEVDKETFVRFTQFAYLENYSVPEMIIKVEQHQEPQIPDSPTDDCWGRPGPTASKKKAARGLSPSPPPPRQLFSSLSYNVKTQSKFAGTFEPIVTTTSNENSRENVSEILLVHASLYVLGEKWGVEELKTLALSKLHQTLRDAPCEALDIQHIVKLTRYTYSDERTPNLKNGIDRLRELVCYYNTTIVELSMQNSVFLALIEEGGQFVKDFWQIAAPMIHAAGY